MSEQRSHLQGVHLRELRCKLLMSLVLRLTSEQDLQHLSMPETQQLQTPLGRVTSGYGWVGRWGLSFWYLSLF